MDDFVEYELYFDAYTPATIPMERLAMYMAALAKLFANGANVHFDRLETGSTKQFVRVEKEAAPKVERRLTSISHGDAANDALIGFDEINELLRDDNAVGKLFKWTSNSQAPAVVLEFKGRELPKPQKFGPFTEPVSIDGELIRIGGKDSTAHAAILDAEGKVWNGEVTRELGRQIAKHIFDGSVLRVNGEGKWERKEDGAWSLTNFKINSFEALDNGSLSEVASRLRELRPTDWSDLDNLSSIIIAERGNDEGLH